MSQKEDATSVTCARFLQTKVWIRTPNVSWSRLDWCGCLGWLLVVVEIGLIVVLTLAPRRPDDAPSFGMDLLMQPRRYPGWSSSTGIRLRFLGEDNKVLFPDPSK
jgi:hypothetical protein